MSSVWLKKRIFSEAGHSFVDRVFVPSHPGPKLDGQFDQVEGCTLKAHPGTQAGELILPVSVVGILSGSKVAAIISQQRECVHSKCL